jgi:hypothetical protein
MKLDPLKVAVLCRMFKMQRPGVLSDLLEQEKAKLRSLRLHNPETQSALVRAFCRPSVGLGELSEADRSVLAAAGLPNKSSAQAAFSRFFKRGVGGDLLPGDKAALASAGLDIDDAQVRATDSMLQVRGSGSLEI